MFKDSYRNIYDNINPDEKLIADTIRKAKKNRKVSIKPLKIAAVICCIFIFCGVGLPVMAQNSETIYNLMYAVSPDIAQFFTPVQMLCIDNGIKMEVVSTYIHGKTVEVYITMQDLEGDRVDETCDLFDSYRITVPFDSSAHCKFIEYDPSTKTATFLAVIDHKLNIMNKSKATFSVKRFLSGKQIYNDIPIPIELTDVKTATDTQMKFNILGSNIGDVLDSAEVLTPQQPLEKFTVDGIDITGIGYIDGKLHIQTAVTNNLKNDNHGNIYLYDYAGNQIHCNYSLYWNDGSDEENTISYDEFIFDIPRENIGNYKLYGSFVTAKLLTEGNWQVTFPLVQSQ